MVYILHDDVLRLKITMNDSVSVHKVNSPADLFNDVAGFGLSKAFVLFQKISEFTILAKLQQ